MPSIDLESIYCGSGNGRAGQLKASTRSSCVNLAQQVVVVVVRNIYLNERPDCLPPINKPLI